MDDYRAATRRSTVPLPGTVAETALPLELVRCDQRSRQVYDGPVPIPTALAVVAIRIVLPPRFSSATARDPSASGLTHTSPLPAAETSVP